MRLVAVYGITTDMAVGVDVVEAEPRWMLRTAKEHVYSIYSGSFNTLFFENPGNCRIL